jgi:hypothetical protein
VVDLHGARQIGEEDQARFERRDQQRLEVLVVPGDLTAELTDPRVELLVREVDLADAGGDRQLASSSW